MKIEGVDKVLEMFQGSSLKGNKIKYLTVGYTAPYAIYVHENLEANHPNGGQAKYLTDALRINMKRMVNALARALQNKKGLERGLLDAAQIAKDASQSLVPVDTGFLRDSWMQEIT